MSVQIIQSISNSPKFKIEFMGTRKKEKKKRGEIRTRQTKRRDTWGKKPKKGNKTNQGRRSSWKRRTGSDKHEEQEVQTRRTQDVIMEK